MIEAWQHERPELDVSPFEVLSRANRLSRHLDRARRSALIIHEIDGWEFDVLTALRRAGEPYQLSPGQLLTQTLVTSGTMTNRIDRLEARGFAERLPDRRDRRGVIVRMTEKGRAAVDGAIDDLLAAERNILRPLDAAQQGQLAALLREIVAPLDAES